MRRANQTTTSSPSFDISLLRKLFYSLGRGGFFVDDLAGLAERNMATVALALRAFVDETRPAYDHNDRLLRLTERIAGANHRADAIRIANSLVAMPKFRELYERIR